MIKKIDYKQILNKSGLRATDERLKLIKILYGLNKPSTLKEIMSKIKGINIHEVTLYRTMTSFKDANLIRQIDFGDSVPYFEIIDLKHDHHHIVCTNCKKVRDFIGCDIDKIINRALTQSKEFSSINSHSFELFGLCKTCSRLNK